MSAIEESSALRQRLFATLLACRFMFEGTLRETLSYGFRETIIAIVTMYYCFKTMLGAMKQVGKYLVLNSLKYLLLVKVLKLSSDNRFVLP